MNNIPSISIVITCFNAEKTIIETLNSIYNQTYQNWECIIVEDKSTDDSFNIISNYINDKKRFKLIPNQKNLGNPKSLNIGIKNSKSENIMFVDSDDLLSSHCLERRIKHISDDLDFIVFPNYERFHANIGDLPSETKYSRFSEDPLREFMIHKLPPPWNIMSPLWKKKSLLKLNMFNEKYVRMVDVELSSRSLIYGMRYKFINQEADHFYRITSDDSVVKEKRNKFFLASMIYIEEIREFTIDNAPHRLKLIEKYLFHFFLSVVAMTLVTNQFNAEDSRKLIKCAKENKLISSNSWFSVFSKRLTHRLAELPIIRTLIWRGVNLYIKK